MRLFYIKRDDFSIARNNDYNATLYILGIPTISRTITAIRERERENAIALLH